MHRYVIIASLAALAACSDVSAQVQDASPASVESLQQQIVELRAQVSELQAQRSDQWLTEQRVQEIRKLTQEVLADADMRASLLDSPVTAGYDGGFVLGDSAGNFKLKVNGLEQFRFVWNRQENSLADDYRYGFENARTKIIFSGNVVDPTWIYRIEGNFNRSGGDFGLLDAYIGHALGGGWTVLAGQFKVPMLREELVLDPYQLTVERSLVNQEFTAGRTQGVAIDWQGEELHFVGGFTDGHPATGGFNMPWSVGDNDYSLTARGEWLAAGQWSQFIDMTSWRGEDFAALFGGAVHYQSGESGTPADELKVFQWTIDASLEFGGANLMAYVVGRHLDSNAFKLDQYGLIVQAGYFLTDDVEAFARYEWGDDDSLTQPDLSVVTVGVNKYFHKHNLKWTTDLGYGINEITSTWASGFIGQSGDIAGWRTDAPDESGQVVVRSQLQLMF